MADLSDYIDKTCIENEDLWQNFGNSDYDTQDYFFVPFGLNFVSKIYASDYAVLNGASFLKK